ncbi:hypothetical protein [Romboutsia sp.]|uniref:hypothetical protein n=1 Tax=Romboutsia sp. TaxID=1965302 RepID=UPI002BBFF8BA|nr:hypothetical protein [Romboutsia sp.]HSQ89176.1 hypothetical protein [Romboutsia sp.]
MTKTYKFNDKDFNKGNSASQNIKMVLIAAALIIAAATLDLSMMEIVSESAIFM